MDTQIIQPKTYQDFMEAGWANLQNKYFSKGNQVPIYYEPTEFAWEDGQFVCQHPNIEWQESVTDFHDPSNFYGHGQTSQNYLICLDCDEDLTDTQDEPDEWEDR